MKHRGFLSANERAARAELTRLAHNYPFLCGSLVTMARKCGKKGCKCQKGELHIFLCLSILVNCKRKMIHVPKDLEEKISL